ncbi:glycosyltransferase family 2 protein [Sphingomonas sabuli]|nr:glycosyltransferase family 2 protein [Sphingomonas sabuli]
MAGRSARAYEYWIAAHEAAPEGRGPEGSILVAVDCSAGTEGIEQSLASMPIGQKIVIVGGATADVPSVARAADLANHLPARGGWVLPLPCGDLLSFGALTSYARAAAEPGVTLIYADDDLIAPSGKRRAPHFKPDWNPELFEWHDFITGSCAIKTDRAKLAALPDTGWIRALAQTAIGEGVPLHLHRVLHHRRNRPDPVLPAQAVGQALSSPPLVTAIIPTRDHVALLRTCVEGLRGADYPAIEIIVADNDSRESETLAYLADLRRLGVKVIDCPGPFNYSRINNAAVAHATGDLLCFLNNDVEMADPGWLSPLVRQAVRPDIGAVGARLLYPDGTIQHAGVYTGIGGGAGHAHRFQQRDETGYFDRARLPQRVSAVTGACLVVAQDKFNAVGGFDEQDFAVAFNDVDLCLKLNSRGWQSFYEPRSTLIHHESKSRGSDRLRRNRTRFADELAALKRKWGTDLATDPYHHPHLSPFSEQFVIGI